VSFFVVFDFFGAAGMIPAFESMIWPWLDAVG
jgi:hypothetical protein